MSQRLFKALCICCLGFITILAICDVGRADTVAYYRFENDLVSDSSGNSNTLSVIDAPVQIALPATGPGSEFPNPMLRTGSANMGSVDFLNSSPPSLERIFVDPVVSGSFTVEAFVHAYNLGNRFGQNIVANVNSPTGATKGFLFSVRNLGDFGTSPNELVLFIWDTNGAIHAFGSGFIMLPSKDYYVAASFDELTNSVDFYRRNLTDESPLETANVVLGGTWELAGTESLRIGSLQGNLPWDGLIDEVRLSNTVLTENHLLIASAQPSSNTPTGTDVVVQPADATTGQSPVSFNFQEIVVPGETTVTTTEQGEPPSGFRLGNPATFYELDTTAEFNGTVELCFDYSGISYDDEPGIRLFHLENGNWIDVTTSLDTENDIICGQVTSFSPFAIVELDNNPPTAIAGPDQSIRAGDVVLLDGTASFDDNTAAEDLMHGWVVTAPDGSDVPITPQSQNVSLASFEATQSGTYTATLYVDDEGGLGSSDDVLISTDNLAPTSVIETDYTIAIVTNTVFVSGANSFDPEMDPLSYEWGFDKPAGSNAVLNSTVDPVNPTFTPDIEGTYTVTLTVYDFIGPGNTATVEIVASSAEEFAEVVIIDTTEEIKVMTTSEVTSEGNKTAMTKQLAKAVECCQRQEMQMAIKKLDDQIKRVDGVALRGSVDTNGPSRDWITDPVKQRKVYDDLNAAKAAMDSGQ